MKASAGVVGTDPFALAVSTVTLFLGEAVLAWAFFLGLVVGLRSVARHFGVQLRACRSWAVTDAALARFFGGMVVLVAAWSVLFKIVLYAQDPAAHERLSSGAAFWYANGAEVVLVFLVLVGLWRWMRATS